ncbi:ShlB/FhaC/HecB family hemolysin secretion/activation protein [Pseudomonas aeruginosa]|uniref:ShlB/FhaC/HecB family hemolysin secretion/activation protein n=1 Tax=Pseudomonas aeruginosa TaxID=287 RepID=UPI003CFB9F39
MLHRDDCEQDRHEPGAQPQHQQLCRRHRLEDDARITETQLGFNHGRRIGGGFSRASTSAGKGIGALGVAGRGRTRSDPHAALRQVQPDLSYLQPFQRYGASASASTAWPAGQRREDVLFSPQRIGLGGNSSVLAASGPNPDRRQRRLLAPSVALARSGVSAAAWLQEYGVAFATATA